MTAACFIFRKLNSTTSSATGVTNAAAQLNGPANPNGSSTTGWFRYSTTSPGTCNDTFGVRAPSSGGTALGAGNSSQGYSQPINGLSAGTGYYFCAIASNAEGTAFGTVLSFTTPNAPTAVTQGHNDPNQALKASKTRSGGTAAHPKLHSAGKAKPFRLAIGLSPKESGVADAAAQPHILSYILPERQSLSAWRLGEARKSQDVADAAA